MTPESLPAVAGLAVPAALLEALSAGAARVRTPAARSAEPAPAEALRARTVTWSDPLDTVARASRLSGLEYLEALRDGDLPAPPIARLLRIGLVEVEEGRAVFEADPGEDHYNPIGLVHGGLAATLLDSALGCAVHATLPQGATYSTIEIKVNYVRPVTRDTGPLRAEGTVVHRGATIATAEGRIVAARTGKLVAHGTTTVSITMPEAALPSLRAAA
jgi:uncharacterized protein (TIGR00369 family)